MNNKFGFEMKLHGALFAFFTISMVGIAGYSDTSLSTQIAFFSAAFIAIVSGCMSVMLLLISRQFSLETPEGKWRGDLYIKELDAKPWLSSLVFSLLAISVGIFLSGLSVHVVKDSPRLIFLLFPGALFILFCRAIINKVSKQKFSPESDQ
ncbi:TPA: hypothetical protein PXO57_004199 [Yersinia enterocolitica]|uniref:hypothetical protein n=1 Tax=Yersinia enterocolitica TaxID=630 RepID=UPI0005E3F015|nr:hypothetical protein [Yersinia enterocolitica]EKN3440392.1 hypothetical protein [Yersinia enterocolitica]EKN3506105.1 hypothetical protein [Yersinia enterocolitica]EKN3636755.1 hypothetical protein [Yersinia enterocolitica]EKN4050247.1 hypothetical protein [Yersinia enterocolitica]EKN4760814.1 hypothetical protein [Yersinia enterocolitica]